MLIGDFDTSQRILVIAEIGNNHEGNFDIAAQLVKAAALAGVDAVKFQTYKTEQFMSVADPNRFERLKSFELTYDQFRKLADLAHELKLLFLSTPLDLESAAFLAEIADGLKIASSDLKFYPLLEVVAASGKPLIVSTGLSEIDQIMKTTLFLEETWKRNQIQDPQLSLLHCVTAYPVPNEQVFLRAISVLANQFPSVEIGYSDHTMGIDACTLAVALGARIIEKHFTMDNNYSSFRDHQLSADPSTMAKLVTAIKEAETLLGKYEKVVQEAERSLEHAVLRSIAAKHFLPEGHLISFDDLVWLRPGGGLLPGQEHQLIGKVLVHSVEAGQQVLPSDVA